MVVALDATPSHCKGISKWPQARSAASRTTTQQKLLRRERAPRFSEAVRKKTGKARPTGPTKVLPWPILSKEHSDRLTDASGRVNGGELLMASLAEDTCRWTLIGLSHSSMGDVTRPPMAAG